MSRNDAENEAHQALATFEAAPSLSALLSVYAWLAKVPSLRPQEQTARQAAYDRLSLAPDTLASIAALRQECEVISSLQENPPHPEQLSEDERDEYAVWSGTWRELAARLHHLLEAMQQPPPKGPMH